VHKRIRSAVKRVKSVSDRMSYIILRGHWCHVIVLNIHAPREEGKGRHSYKLKTRNESLHEISNDNEIRLVHFATSKNLRVKSTTAPHRNIENPKFL
jgi:hypothetical protein